MESLLSILISLLLGNSGDFSLNLNEDFALAEEPSTFQEEPVEAPVNKTYSKPQAITTPAPSAVLDSTESSLDSINWGNNNNDKYNYDTYDTEYWAECDTYGSCVDSDGYTWYDASYDYSYYTNEDYYDSSSYETYDSTASSLDGINWGDPSDYSYEDTYVEDYSYNDYSYEDTYVEDYSYDDYSYNDYSYNDYSYDYSYDSPESSLDGINW